MLQKCKLKGKYELKLIEFKMLIFFIVIYWVHPKMILFQKIIKKDQIRLFLLIFI